MNEKYYIDFRSISTRDEEDEIMIRIRYMTEKSPYTGEEITTGYREEPIITKTEFINCYNRWIRSNEENNK